MRIHINVTKAVAAVAGAMPVKADTKRILRGLGASATQYWKKLAQEGLKSSSRDYVAGIQMDEGKGEVKITLSGRMPNMIENGFPGGDMRRWLLSGPNAKTGKDGKVYNTIPFRHGTPGTGGRNVGSEMPKSIHAVAKKLSATVSRPGRSASGTGASTTVWGQRLNPNMRMSQTARSILGRVEKPWHATSIYMGMVRKAQPTASGKMQTSGYTTFRRISASTRGPQHWIHPGIKPRRFAVQVTAHVQSLARAIIAQALEGGGG